MLFNSFHFLFFFPLVTIAYFLIPSRWKWVWLLICSYYFYMSWSPKYAILIAGSTIITFFCGILIERANRQADIDKGVFLKKFWLALSFISNLLILFFFKYFDFTLANINWLFEYIGIDLINPTFSVLLPVGISFYTFQALGYTVDVYRNDVKAEKNIGKYALFVSFFPQLVAGPIERTRNLLPQVSIPHNFDYLRVKYGLLLMGWGLFQKIFIADRAALIVNGVYDNYLDYSGSEIVIATIIFAFQIFCDFSGYSDIAIGAAGVLGIKLMENFRQPYLATSVQDFWRRWHISLSTWFRDYLYIPLGGSKSSLFKKYRNILITFFASGLWHGARWNFVAWGLLHGFYLIIGDMVSRKSTYNNQVPGKMIVLSKRILTFALVCFAWIFFRSPGLDSALDIIQRIFLNFNISDFLSFDIYMDADLAKSDCFLLLLGIAILLVCNIKQQSIMVRAWVIKQHCGFRWLFYFTVVFVLIFFAIYFRDSVSQQFIYFQF